MQRKILLVDDDPLVLKTTAKLLEKEGYQVLPVNGSAAAMEAIGTNEFDLILSDIRMPGKNGVEAANEIQETLLAAGKRDLPIVFITGYAEFGVQLKANFVGEVLYKPVDNDRLLATIRDYL